MSGDTSSWAPHSSDQAPGLAYARPGTSSPDGGERRGSAKARWLLLLLALLIGGGLGLSVVRDRALASEQLMTVWSGGTQYNLKGAKGVAHQSGYLAFAGGRAADAGVEHAEDDPPGHLPRTAPDATGPPDHLSSY